MDVGKINSPEDLRDWLRNKPINWAQIIAARAAFRLVHWCFRGPINWQRDHALQVLRSLLISWAACNYPALDFRRSAKFAALRCRGAANDAEVSGDGANAGIAAHAAANAAHSIADHEASIDFATETADLARSAGGGTAYWSAVQDDCNWLESLDLSPSQSRRLSRQPLWIGNALIASGDLTSLLELDLNFAVWLVWYERRFRGERAAFDIPGDKGRVEDKKILRRLAEATDEDFWGKGHEYVNATLKSWLEEAQARVAPPAASLGTINPDPQDARSPQFGLDATGRISLSSGAGVDQLRSDPQALSRHARAVTMAQRLGEGLRNHNNAGYMTGLADDYIAAMADGQEGADPSGLVFAGDQLRSAITKHRSAGREDDLQPLPPSADRDAEGFLSAHNMYVGSDPFLDDLDRTTRGPDTPLPAAHPAEIRRVVIAAHKADILGEPTHDYLVAAADAAPVTYDAADRHSRFAAGLAQNFARYGIEFLWAYPNEAAWAGLVTGVGVTMTLGPLAAAGGTVAGITIAYHLARNIIANEAFYRTLLATSPAGEDNFQRLIRFIKSLPFKSLKDG